MQGIRFLIIRKGWDLLGPSLRGWMMGVVGPILRALEGALDWEGETP